MQVKFSDVVALGSLIVASGSMLISGLAYRSAYLVKHAPKLMFSHFETVHDDGKRTFSVTCTNQGDMPASNVTAVVKFANGVAVPDVKEVQANQLVHFTATIEGRRLVVKFATPIKTNDYYTFEVPVRIIDENAFKNDGEWTNLGWLEAFEDRPFDDRPKDQRLRPAAECEVGCDFGRGDCTSRRVGKLMKFESAAMIFN